ncbi:MULTISPECIES: MarC family protein [Vibrio]|uniref:MarC family protein n=1 Tax=Vibrio TaxID=662 RepID=UPI00056E7DAF|nr:MarC family protein [Vibrio pacinii]
MQEILIHGITVFMGFFAIMNPLANMPIFLSLTSGESNSTIKATALKATVLAFVVIFFFSIAGKLVFDMFGITVYALRITGGIIVFQIGLKMLQGDTTHSKTKEKATSIEQKSAALGVAVSPLAVPILAGPGTISTAMNYSMAGSFIEVVITLCAFAAMCAITYFVFIFGDRLVKHLGPSGLDMITKMMGLILAMIGCQMLIEGIADAVKSLM